MELLKELQQQLTSQWYNASNCDNTKAAYLLDEIKLTDTKRTHQQPELIDEHKELNDAGSTNEDNLTDFSEILPKLLSPEFQAEGCYNKDHDDSSFHQELFHLHNRDSRAGDLIISMMDLLVNDCCIHWDDDYSIPPGDRCNAWESDTTTTKEGGETRLQMWEMQSLSLIHI